LPVVSGSGKGKGALAGKLNAPFHLLPECTAATEGATRAEHRGIAAHPWAVRLGALKEKQSHFNIKPRTLDSRMLATIQQALSLN